ncbi:unnamed protein product, partial [Laminaria digitata]
IRSVRTTHLRRTNSKLNSSSTSTCQYCSTAQDRYVIPVVFEFTAGTAVCRYSTRQYSSRILCTLPNTKAARHCSMGIPWKAEGQNGEVPQKLEALPKKTIKRTAVTNTRY